MRKAAEDYLETIYRLEQEKDVVHSVDVAARLGGSKPSVSRAVNQLRASGCLAYERTSALHLTNKGRAEARSVYERHTVIARFLIMTLGLSQQAAEHDACLFEHDISPETLQRMQVYIRNVK